LSLNRNPPHQWQGQRDQYAELSKVQAGQAEVKHRSNLYNDTAL
jgi:hypothetical protein